MGVEWGCEVVRGVRMWDGEEWGCGMVRGVRCGVVKGVMVWGSERSDGVGWWEEWWCGVVRGMMVWGGERSEDVGVVRSEGWKTKKDEKVITKGGEIGEGGGVTIHLQMWHEFFVEGLVQKLAAGCMEVSEETGWECPYPHGTIVHHVTYLDECIVKQFHLNGAVLLQRYGTV